MDAAIADFLKRLEAQEQDLYAWLHGALSHLPVPGKVGPKGLSVHAAMEADMLPLMVERRRAASHPQRCCCISMLRTTGMFDYILSISCICIV